MYDARLALYDLDTLVDLLPLAQDFNAGIPLNDDSTISFTLPAIDTVDGVGVASITGVYQYLYNYDIALQVSQDGSWIEPPNCRFYLMDDDVDPSAANGIKFSGVLAGGFDLSGVVNLDPSMFVGKDLVRQFTDATPGTYMVTMLQDAHAQGLGTALSWDFTTSHDSSGTPWPLAVSMGLKQNATARDVLASLTAQGLCDWRFEGNVLRMFSPDGSMHMTKPGIELMLGREVTSGPQKRSVAEMMDKVLVLGDEGYTLLRSRTSSRRRGPRAVVQSQGGVSQEATAILFAENVLDKGSQIRGELTRDISLHDDCLYLPFFDYGVGDEVMAPGTAGMLEPLRVFQITLSKGGNESLVSGNVLFGDRFLEFLTKQSRRINGILGGSTLSGGTNATPVPTSDVDMRTPAAPTGLVGDSSAFFDTDGNVHAQVFLQWLPVITADNGSALEVMAYDVYVREEVPGSPWVVLTTTAIPAAAWQPFSVGSVWRFQVRAIGKYTVTPGLASDDVVVTMVTDATPPGVPSVPVVTSGLGIVHATWDGLVRSGSLSVAPPIDFNRVEVAIGTSASPVVVVGALGSAGTVHVVADPGTTQYARARAIDRSGNTSAWSASASVVVASVLDDPAVAGAIADGSIIGAETVVADKIAAGAITADKIEAGAITASKIAAGAIDTAMLTVGTTIGDLADDVATLTGQVGDITGAVIINGAGVTITNGNSLNPHQVTISNDRMAFTANGAEVAYIDSEYNKFFVTQAEITQTLKVGVHQIQKYNEDVTLIRWVG